MNDKTKYGIVAIVIVAAIFGLYAAFATTTTTNEGSTKSSGGVGGSILCKIYPPSCSSNSNCTQGKPSASNPCIDDCGFPISSDVNPVCI